MDPEICRRLREARRNAALSQSSVANEIGCKQSALSMFEQGDGTKLGEESIRKLCEKFGLEFPGADNAVVLKNEVHWSEVAGTGFCPNPRCPSHLSYEVEGRMFLKPDRKAQDPAGGKFCAVCGEILERSCPECGKKIHEGAICTFCGHPYVIPVE